MNVPFRTRQHVYFDDLDALNILHNVRFLLFMERARGELFNTLGFRWEQDFAVNPDKYHVVAEHRIEYLQPVRGEGDVVVSLTVTHLGRSSCILHARVESIDGVATFAEGHTRIVRLDPVTNRPCSWSARFREAMKPLVRSVADAGESQPETPKK